MPGALNEASQGAALTEEVLLADDLVQGARPHARRQRRMIPGVEEVGPFYPAGFLTEQRVLSHD
ncbi:hypothetical protein GCM10027031_02110 [Corynebacterium atrinae]